MKIKKTFLLIITIIIAIALVACSNKIGSTKFLEKEGIKPYKLSQSEEYILQTFGMEGNSQIISFHAPKEAITLRVNVYRLEDNKKWSNIGGGGTSIGKDREPV